MASDPDRLHQTDVACMRRMAAGDERALAELYDRHATVIYALAAAILGDADDAEEVAADAFVQAWRSAPSYAAERGSVLAWLTTIVRSRALDLLRTRRRRARVLDAALALDAPRPGALPDPLGDTLYHELRAQVEQGLRAIPEPQRRVLELAYFGGLSQREIAESLSEPLGTIKARTRAGLEKLRALLRSTVRTDE